MNEIEKLYENAGIELGCCKYAEYGYEGEEGTWYYCIKENKECWTYPNGDADCVEKGYPPFTAEKELKLIKWFAHSGHFSHRTDYLPWILDDIAGHINFLWQNLTEEEKQKVKGILE